MSSSPTAPTPGRRGRSLPSPQPRRLQAARALVAAWLIALPSGATAAGAPPLPGDGGLISVAVGRAGFREMRVKTQLAVSYHHRAVLPRVRPAAGVLASSGGDAFFFLGCSSDLALARRVGVTPLLSAGYYSEGDGTRLGGALEFRSAVELWVRVGRTARVGVCVDHLSNAGLFDDNPGRESLTLSFASLR
jgi:hypothetical protein